MFSKDELIKLMESLSCKFDTAKIDFTKSYLKNKINRKFKLDLKKGLSKRRSVLNKNGLTGNDSIENLNILTVSTNDDNLTRESFTNESRPKEIILNNQKNKESLMPS